MHRLRKSFFCSNTSLLIITLCLSIGPVRSPLLLGGGANYHFTAEESRKYVLSYCRSCCEEIVAKPRLHSCVTFEKALDGDFQALHTVFTDENYHTSDNQWIRVPWHILQVVGDARFAEFVLSRPLAERQILIEVDPIGVDNSKAFEDFFRQHFPKTHGLQRELLQSGPEPRRKGFNYAVRDFSAVLTEQAKFEDVRLYKGANGKTIVQAPRSLSNKDKADLNGLVVRYFHGNAELIFK